MDLIPGAEQHGRHPEERAEPPVLSHQKISEPPGSEDRVRRRLSRYQSWKSEMLSVKNKTKAPPHTHTHLHCACSEGYFHKDLPQTHEPAHMRNYTAPFSLKSASHINVTYFTGTSVENSECVCTYFCGDSMYLSSDSQGSLWWKQG